MINFKKEGLYFVALGGADEIGLNCYVYASGGKFIMVDCGYGFLNDNYPGIDVCFADASFFTQYADKFEGIFITHAHEDHFGAISHIWPLLKCPVYGTDFTLALVDNRLSEYGLRGAVKLHAVKDEKIVKTPNFEVEFISIVHSVPETAALFISAGGQKVVHATDWRFDDGAIPSLQTDYAAFKAIADKGVDMFVCDSTNIQVDKKQPSEDDVRRCLIELMPTLKNTVAATCFASNLTRLESLIIAADKAGRTPVLLGKSLVKNVKIAVELGYFQGLPKCLEAREAENLPTDNALYICTGSQANYRSALSSVVANQSRYLKVAAGDTVIFSSKIIPGNEEKIEEMQEKLIAQGVCVITDKDALVHTSGHCSKEELAEMYSLLKPKVVLPVHGSKKFIREHKKFAHECGVKDVVCLTDGELIRLWDKSVKGAGIIPTDVLAVDRTQVVPLSSEVIKHRRQIAYNGSVFVSVIFGEKWELIAMRISSKDILEPESFGLLRDKIVEDMSADMNEIVKKLKYKEKGILEYIRVQVRRRIEKATEMRPVSFIHFYKLPLEEVVQFDDTDNTQPLVIYPSSDAE